MLNGHRDRFDESVRDLRRVFLGGDVFEQDRELVATESGDGVGGPHARAQTLGDRAQELVAGRVTEAVVDVLEPVEVDEQHGERARMTDRPRASA